MALPAEVFAALETEEVPCPLCGATARILLSTQLGRFGVVRCARCRLVRLSPRPTAAAARRLYDESYYAAGGYDDYVATYERFRGLFHRFYARRLSLLARHVPWPGRILEVGCAHGFQLAWLREQGWDAVGNEVSAAAARYARDQLGLTVSEGPLEKLDFPPVSFDAVYMIHILEHLYEPIAAMARVRAALKPRGALLVQCPYELYHWEKVAQAAWERRRPGTIAPDAVPYHLAFYTPRTLRLMLERGGFRILARYSGNYGAIRKRQAPPRIKTGDPFETALRYLYFKLGFRDALRALSLPLKQGSGVIFAAAPR